MTVARIGVLDYGMGNLRSVTKALEHVGADPALLTRPEETDAVDGLVVPGVGAFGACMAGLRERGLDVAIRSFAGGDRPLLGVCLGLQVLFEWSEEGEVDGLGILAGKVRRLPVGVKVPHMGWNEVSWRSDHPYIRAVPPGTRFYFVHSYFCDAPTETVVGMTEHGIAFPAVVARGRVFGTQFHPEKSGAPGLELYRAFVKAVA